MRSDAKRPRAFRTFRGILPKTGSRIEDRERGSRSNFLRDWHRVGLAFLETFTFHFPSQVATKAPTAPITATAPFEGGLNWPRVNASATFRRDSAKDFNYGRNVQVRLKRAAAAAEVMSHFCAPLPTGSRESLSIAGEGFSKTLRGDREGAEDSRLQGNRAYGERGQGRDIGRGVARKDRQTDRQRERERVIERHTPSTNPFSAI